MVVRRYTSVQQGVSVMGASRRVGAETSKTRELLLDAVERLMLEEGYASVTYRAVAAKADATASLVQYYFPTLDDIFLAAIRRSTERNLARLAERLKARPDEPLHVLWENSWHEATAALMTEFMALGNHRKSIGAELTEATGRLRQVQLDALTATYGRAARFPGELSPNAALLMITGVPKFLQLEEGIGVDDAHGEVVGVIERFLDSVEAHSASGRRKPRPRK
jgi:AcrR family transcriptional regulator